MTGLFTFLQEQYRNNWTSVNQDNVPAPQNYEFNQQLFLPWDHNTSEQYMMTGAGLHCERLHNNGESHSHNEFLIPNEQLLERE
ncbi:hypothetical protein PCANC_00823 [Puccinia coronata f. sp. avenae]|uniref:Uncharacterized protein n=1 Tax=Puccinia coronata f. sp. avenae TaxID=200324 RepID=A0A2N5W7G2_9BASI|nr:hypothetical protein PCANC_00823 [Puccinia coronata f. sp. avenae]